MSHFDANIKTRITEDRLQLTYLIQHCTSRAKSAIDDCIILPPEQGCAKAKKLYVKNSAVLTLSFAPT